MNRNKEANKSTKLMGLAIARNVVMTTDRVVAIGATFIFAAAMLITQAAAAQTLTTPGAGASGGSTTTAGSTKTDQPAHTTVVSPAPVFKPGEAVVTPSGGKISVKPLDTSSPYELPDDHLHLINPDASRGLNVDDVGPTEPTKPATTTPTTPDPKPGTQPPPQEPNKPPTPPKGETPRPYKPPTTPQPATPGPKPGTQPPPIAPAPRPTIRPRRVS
jgi:hypothetical protein